MVFEDSAQLTPEHVHLCLFLLREFADETEPDTPARKVATGAYDALVQLLVVRDMARLHLESRNGQAYT